MSSVNILGEQQNLIKLPDKLGYASFKMFSTFSRTFSAVSLVATGITSTHHKGHDHIVLSHHGRAPGW